MLTLEFQSLSIHSLKSIYTTCWWNFNKIVWSELHKTSSFLTKNKQQKKKKQQKQKQKQKQKTKNKTNKQKKKENKQTNKRFLNNL